jgi:hypothetical protein
MTVVLLVFMVRVVLVVVDALVRQQFPTFGIQQILFIDDGQEAQFEWLFVLNYQL